MKNRLWPLLYNGTQGYIPINREALEYLLKQIEHPTDEVVYLFMLHQAQFKDGQIIHGIRLKRGDLYLNPHELEKYTKWKKSKIYHYLNRLIRDGFLKKLKWGEPIYHMNYYEEHCGKLITNFKLKEEKTSPDDTSFEDFYDFYHYALDITPTEKVKARREWNKLTPDEREVAMQHITDYSESIRKREHIKHACNYLRDKTFLTYVES